MAEAENERLEIGHVLFVDIVGYSKLLIEEQKERLHQLTEIVLATGEVRAASNEQLVRLPTGDGMALVFRNSSEEPARCALEIAQALKEKPEVEVRMGIHSGPVSEVTDVSGRTNIAGAGINMAQRVMDCGDAGHILASQRVADDLRQYRQWSSRLHDLGECEVKHKVRLHLFNLYEMDLGNPAVPQRLQKRRRSKPGTKPRVTTGKTRKSNRWLGPALALLGIVMLIAAFLFFGRWNVTEERRAAVATPSPDKAGIPEKSIAVLPFENRSEDKANAYFADGIQDEILTRLSKIADLKVISRTSTEHYKSAPENLPEIAKQLGVAHVVEGSVQKNGDSVRVNVQLIKAATDSHQWADTFDRELTDIFSVESEVARAIADQLQAKLSGREEQVIAAKPTDNPEAYDAYLRGLAYTLKPVTTPVNVLSAQNHLRTAVRLDPKFALGWALLSFVDSTGYISHGLPQTAAVREEARQAAETALTLQPNLGEAILAKGYYHYACLKDYDTGVHYFEAARQFLPNSSRIPESLAYVARRQGHWDRSESYFDEAEHLDPRNVNLITQHALFYDALRRFPEALRKLDQVLDIVPDDGDTLAQEAGIAQAQGDLPRAAVILASLHPNADDIQALEIQAYQAILGRQPATIIPRLKEILDKPDPALDTINSELRSLLGWAQEVAGDHDVAQETWRQARGELESFLKDQPDNFRLIEDLALTNMGLGDKDAALALSERAMAANPIEKDALFGPRSLEILVRVAAQTGEPDRAITALQKLLSMPGGGRLRMPLPLTPALLRLDPMFDPLRNDPRFQKLASDASQSATPAMPTIPEKSIAVLPFENLSANQENGFFADGVQDEILTDLAKVADLKVISRTSVINYRQTTGRNLGQIGRELGVAHVLEGSVQRAGNRVRVNAQLVDTRTDTHLWAQTYDRDLADVFAIQSEIAKAIADQLQAKLSPNEKAAIEEIPTSDVAAFDLYSRAKTLVLSISFGSLHRQSLFEAADLLKQAVARDPAFFQAWCLLVFAQDQIYFFHDHTAERLALAETALQAASRLRPDSGETHLARAQHLYWGRRDYEGALVELESAHRSLPNDPRSFELTGYIRRREGRWEEVLPNLQRALELDPRNYFTLQQTALFYANLHRFPEMAATLDRVLAVKPDDAETKAARGLVDLDGKADTRPLHQAIDEIRARGPGALKNVADYWFTLALAERDPAAAADALIALGDNYLTTDVVELRPSFCAGLVARMTNEDAKAQTAFAAAREEQQKIVQAQPDYGPALCVLALIDAGLGRKDEALAEGRRAMELLPVTKDSINGFHMIEYFAVVAAWVGEKDLACEQIARAVALPGYGLDTYGQLKLSPFWDPLRGDPRFEKIVADLAPKDTAPAKQ